jgi:multidrug resistance efflux pump
MFLSLVWNNRPIAVNGLEATMRIRKHILGLGIVIAALLLNGCDALGTSQENILKASGVVEIMEISIAAELGGRVDEVFVEEGDLVQMDQALFRLDDEELQLQRMQVEASGEAARASAQLALLETQQALEDLQENWPLQAAGYQIELAQARDALETAENRLIWNQKNNRATEETIEYYEAQLVLAEKQAKDARSYYNQFSDKPEQDTQRAAARVALEEAEKYVDHLVSVLNWYSGEPTDIDQAMLEANVAMARAQVDEAAREFEKWKEGPDPDALRLAEAAIANAQALLELARVQAESQLRTIDLMLEDSVIVAPVGAVVLNHSIEVGEVILPGVAVMTLGNVERMTITVYLAENQYGQISVGDRAAVTVDSFPDEVFDAEVIRIADEAEYTPRNVQTEEERQTTVYAVELRMDDPAGKLKPGMPADVSFSVSTGE